MPEALVAGELGGGRRPGPVDDRFRIAFAFDLQLSDDAPAAPPVIVILAELVANLAAGTSPTELAPFCEPLVDIDLDGARIQAKARPVCDVECAFRIYIG